jgi:hypothetical protein
MYHQQTAFPPAAAPHTVLLRAVIRPTRHAVPRARS